MCNKDPEEQEISLICAEPILAGGLHHDGGQGLHGATSSFAAAGKQLHALDTADADAAPAADAEGGVGEGDFDGAMAALDGRPGEVDADELDDAMAEL